jgi:hypothetical protein
MVGGEISEEMKRLYAIGKLTQVVLIQYLARRNAYPESCFMKRTYVDLEFFTLDAKDEKGAKLDEIIRTAGTFINNQCLKTFRFQIFTDSERPNVRF